MDDETFRHHVNSHKNDFATWIEHSVGNRKLALRLSSVTTSSDMAKHVEEHLIEVVDKNRKQVKEKTEQPIKIVTPNVTKLHLTHRHERVITPHTTSLTLNSPRHIVHTMNRTLLHLSQKQKHLPVEIASYICFGIVVGTALGILILL